MTNDPAKNEITAPARGIVDLACNRSVVETADRLESLLKAKGIQVFARIDRARRGQGRRFDDAADGPFDFWRPKSRHSVDEPVSIPRHGSAAQSLGLGIGRGQSLVELQQPGVFAAAAWPGEPAL